MNASRIAGIALRQFYLYKGNFARVVPLFAFVAVDMVLWGFMTRYLNSVASHGHDFVPALLGAVLLWDFFARVMQGLTMGFFEDVWSRNFLNVFATPLTLAEYVSGLVLTSIVTSAIGLLVMLLLSSTVFGLSFAAYGVMFVPFILILFLFGTALGILGSALVLRLGPAAEWFVWPIPSLLSPFVGVFYPLATLPEWMQWVGRTLPPSYVFEGVRTLAAGGEFPVSMLGWGLGLAVLDIVLAALCFQWVYRYAVRTGLLARYSAESVN
ncbi:ABC transporter permease [Corallococcus sp. bb12-1]|uniref:ABC transporter permease n=1 Tax=Corallococcus sp. bb12-1 TaxID=2996784 RepID=UPI00226DFEBA|nr:ABC transporter permease [Corallococcus sp. bb12-1]MCY1040170.1 ABC transporter permease [Corallococcus sp. bb12-1]